MLEGLGRLLVMGLVLLFSIQAISAGIDRCNMSMAMPSMNTPSSTLDSDPHSHHMMDESAHGHAVSDASHGADHSCCDNSSCAFTNCHATTVILSEEFRLALESSLSDSVKTALSTERVAPLKDLFKPPIPRHLS